MLLKFGDGLTCLFFKLLAQIESGKILLFYSALWGEENLG